MLSDLKNDLGSSLWGQLCGSVTSAITWGPRLRRVPHLSLNALSCHLESPNMYPGVCVLQRARVMERQVMSGPVSQQPALLSWLPQGGLASPSSLLPCSCGSSHPRAEAPGTRSSSWA